MKPDVKNSGKKAFTLIELLVVIAIINAIIGIFYYFRVIVAMYFKEGKNIILATPIQFKFVLALSAILTVVFGLYPSLISELF